MKLRQIFNWISNFFSPSTTPIRTAIGPYIRSSILTNNEREFHARLRQACPAPLWEIWPQVAMTALVTTRIEPGYANGWADFNKIQAKRLDWVVARRGQPLLVIELDDRTHNHAADAQRDKILCGCGWPVLRFDSRAKPTVGELAEAIQTVARKLT